MDKKMDDRLNRQNWLNAGLQALADEGPEGLRIMSIARQMGVTKGSFYWHFRNHEEFQSALLAEWEQRHTKKVIVDVEEKGGDSLMKLRNLMTMTVGSDPRLAQAIRTWAITSAMVNEAQVRVDQDRVNYLVTLLGPLGWPNDKAQTLARWMYCALIGHFHLQGPPIGAEHIELILAILIPKKNSK
jgi:AcrR family transcriptional regulator